MNFASEIHKLVEAVCPIQGVSIGDRRDKATWRIDFDDSAIDVQRAEAAKIIADFEVNQ